MSLYYAYSGPQQHPTPVHSHHGGRNRRAGRPATVGQSNQNSQNGAQNIQRLRAGRKDVELSFPLSNFRMKFEATRTFDLEDDLEFCPALLTDSDLESINSGSERSSLASNSPQSSPTQQPTSVAASFSLNSTSPSFVPPSFHHSQSSLKLHQPAATRTRNAIPIINPATGITMSSPPQSVSPSRMQQQAMQRRY